MEKLLLVVLACTLTACGAVEQRLFSPLSPAYGNFLTAELDPEPLAVAAAKLLTSTLPPAQTRLKIDPPRDAFGMALVSQLRERGYAIFEQASDSQPVADDALALQYVVDQQGSTPADTTYRVVLRLSNQTFARLYTKRNGQFEPLGNWVRGELSP